MKLELRWDPRLEDLLEAYEARSILGAHRVGRPLLLLVDVMTVTGLLAALLYRDWPFVLVFGAALLAVIVFRGPLKRHRDLDKLAIRTWSSHPALRRPRVVELSDRGMILDEVVGATLLPWTRMTHLLETENLLIPLYAVEGAYRFRMRLFGGASGSAIPKRALASPEQVDQVRGMLVRWIGKPVFEVHDP